LRPLNIVVCIKPVPDLRYWDKLVLDPKTKVLRREGIPIIISPMDKNAIEEALRIKESRGGKVSVVSMGPPNTDDVLASAYALGVDDALLLTDRAFAGADTLATAAALVSGIKKLGNFDLVLLGNQSADGSTGQVGPQVGEMLGIPSVTNVSHIEFVGEDTVRMKVTIEMGYMLVEAKLPLSIAVTKEINEVRIPSVFGAIWAVEKTVKKMSADDTEVDKTKIGIKGSPTFVPEVNIIEVQRNSEVLKGSPNEIAANLVEKLRADGVLPVN
jgi:electron transfer flavoprotein beta subunit